MSIESNFIDKARAYRGAHEAYVSTQKGRAELLASHALEKAYVECNAPDVQKEQEISRLSALVLQYFHNSLVFKREKKLLEVKNQPFTPDSLTKFIQAAQTYDSVLREVQPIAQFSTLKATEQIFRAAVLTEFGARSSVKNLQDRLRRQQIEDEWLINQLKTWEAQFAPPN